MTIVGIAMGVHNGLKAADKLAVKGVSAEVIDLRTLVPLDRETIRKSVAKTGRLIVVDEDYHSYGVSGEIIASVVEHDLFEAQGAAAAGDLSRRADPVLAPNGAVLLCPIPTRSLRLSNPCPRVEAMADVVVPRTSGKTTRKR